MILDLSNRNLTTLHGFPLPEGLTELYLSGNRLTSLPRLPRSLTKLVCRGNDFPTHYYYRCGELYSIEKLRIIIMMDRWRVLHSVLSQLIIDRPRQSNKQRPDPDEAARSIQRLWRRYWSTPYYDPGFEYPVCRGIIRSGQKYWTRAGSTPMRQSHS